MINKILVIGGTGMLGQPVAARLITDEYDVRVMTHSPQKAQEIFGTNVKSIFGDVTDGETLRQPMEDCDAVYINLSAKMNPADYEQIEHLGTVNIVKIAKEMGIKRIAMISGLNVDENQTGFPFIVSKAKAEKAVSGSGIPYTIFKCCWFFESLPLFVVKKQATIIGKQPHKRYWIAAADYAGMVSKAFGLSETENRIFHIRGIDQHTIGEAMEQFCEIVYPDIKLSTVPLWLISFMSRFNRNSTTKGVAQFMKYFETVSDNKEMDDTELILGPALTTLRDWAENYKIRQMAR